MEQAVQAASAAAEAPGPDLSGRWINEGGTVIDLRSHDDGRMSGTIRFGSDGSAYKTYQLRGTRVLRPGGENGIVGTVVAWPRPASVTVWCGELHPSVGVLSTKMLMTGGPPPADWETATGGTTFRRPASGRRSA